MQETVQESAKNECTKTEAFRSRKFVIFLGIHLFIMGASLRRRFVGSDHAACGPELQAKTSCHCPESWTTMFASQDVE